MGTLVKPVANRLNGRAMIAKGKVQQLVNFKRLLIKEDVEFDNCANFLARERFL